MSFGDPTHEKNKLHMLNHFSCVYFSIITSAFVVVLLLTGLFVATCFKKTTARKSTINSVFAHFTHQLKEKLIKKVRH